MPRLSVVIPTKDDRQHIAGCLESVRPIADEIVIADAGSRDGTLEVVRQLGGCRIVERELLNDAEFRQGALERARYEWVLFVEANERVTPELAAEIQALLAAPPARDGYSISREHFFLGHPLKHFSWAAARGVRLVRRDRASWLSRRSGRCEPRLVVESRRVGRLKHTLLSYVALDLDRFLARQQREATWLALDAYDAGKRATWLKLAIRAPWLFAKHYLLGGGFLDGRPGLMAAALFAHGALLRDCKLWERQYSRASHDPPRWRKLRHVFSPPAMSEAKRDAD